MSDKTFINKCAIKKKEFPNGGHVLNCAFNIEELESHAKDGWIRLVISERRSPSEKGHTHYAYVDTFVGKIEPEVQPKQAALPQEITNLAGDIPF
jgi:hypothetical protein